MRFIPCMNTLVIPNDRQFTDLNVHRADFIANLAIDAGVGVAAQRKNPKEVENAQECAVRTGVLTPRTLNKQ